LERKTDDNSSHFRLQLFLSESKSNLSQASDAIVPCATSQDAADGGHAPAAALLPMIEYRLYLGQAAL